MKVIALCGVALLAYAALLILGKDRTGPGALIGICGALCILTPTVLALSGVLQEMQDLFAQVDTQYAQLLLKGLGIGLCCEITEDVLNEAGNHTIANALDLGCKVAILSLSLPLLRQLLELLSGVLP